MLIPLAVSQLRDPITELLAQINGRSPAITTLGPGIFLLDHSMSAGVLRSYSARPALSIPATGTCDSVQQLLAACPELEGSERQFVITLKSNDGCDLPLSARYHYSDAAAFSYQVYESATVAN
ncbi:MAG: hypothetical protein ACK443_12560 [Methylococcaceae bacterium]|jgi:hypothetical protein